MAKKVVKSNKYPINKFEDGGASGFSNFMNSDFFKNFSNMLGSYNSSQGSGSFLNMNRGGGGGNTIAQNAFSAVDTTGQVFTAIADLTSSKRRPIDQVIGLPGSYSRSYAGGGNIYAGGGDYMQAAQTGIALVGNAFQQAQIADTTNIKDRLKAYGNTQVSANNFDDLTKEWANRQEFKHISARDLRPNSYFKDFANSLSASAQGASAGQSVGGPWGAAIGGIVGGVSSVVGSLFGRSKASREAKRVNKLVDQTNAQTLLSLNDKANNIGIQNNLNTMANYAAYGGPIGLWGSNALDYELVSNNLNRKELESINKNKIPLFSNQSNNSNIKPFAFGGHLMTNGADWDNGFTYIANGNTHENNPNKGVQIGVDSKGVPNLVEEGEVLYNNYVFSNRLKANGGLLDTVKLHNRYENKTFAYIAKKLSEEIEERPNDPISNNGFNDSMVKLQIAQETVRSKDNSNNKFAKGGNLFAKGSKLNTYRNYRNIDDSWYTDEYDKFWEFIKNNPNSEEAKTLLADINATKYGTVGGNTFTMNDIIRLGHDKKEGPVHEAFKRALTARNTSKPTEVRPTDPLNIYTTRDRIMGDISISPEYLSDYGYTLNDIVDTAIDTNGNTINYLEKPLLSPTSNLNGTDNKNKQGDKENKGDKQGEDDPIGKYNTWLRYAPVLGGGIGLAQNLLSRPDYSNAERIEEMANKVGNYTPITYNPLGNYLTYNPFDREYHSRKLAAQAAATRNAIANNANANRAMSNASLLAADYNAQINQANLMRQAEEYNLAQRQQVEQFNRATNQYNSEADLKTQMANQQARQSALNAKMQGITTAAQLRAAIDNQRSQSIAANFNNIFENLGAIGYDEVGRKGRDYAIKKGVLKDMYNITANGGKINTKKRRGGLTY